MNLRRALDILIEVLTAHGLQPTEVEHPQGSNRLAGKVMTIESLSSLCGSCREVRLILGRPGWWMDINLNEIIDLIEDHSGQPQIHDAVEQFEAEAEEEYYE